MKRTTIHISAAIALLLGLAACTQDEAGFLPEGAEGTPIVFTATGLNPAATATIGTRAPVDGNWEGVQSVAVLMNGTVKAYDVMPSTTDPTNATLTSTDPYYWTNHNDITVTAWWPFDNADITHMPAVKVAEDQSKLADFQKSDFIAAENQTVEFSNPTLEFTHRTARVAIELKPGTGFTSVDGATVSLVSLSANNGNPTAIKTYNASGNIYEALTAPQTVAAGKPFIRVELGGGTFYFRPQNNVVLEAGNRYTYTVKVNANGIEVTAETGGQWDSEGEVLVKSDIIYTAADLKPGDYFYITTGGEWAVSDGGLRKIYADGTTEWEPDKKPDDSKGTCIGIVLKVGRDTEGSWADNGDYTLKGSTTSMSEVHGYVLALRDANGGNSCQWGSFGTQVGCDRNQTTGFNGYSSTQTIVAFNNAQGGTLKDAFPAAYHATNYETVCSAPVNTSGWFLPSSGQCQYWLNHRDVILRSIQNAGGDGWKAWYWSSSEGSYYPAYCAYYLRLRYGSMDYVYKNDVNAVRACLAF